MIKRPNTKARARGPLGPLPDAVLVQVTGGSSAMIEPQHPVVWMREIVHVQAGK